MKKIGDTIIEHNVFSWLQYIQNERKKKKECFTSARRERKKRNWRYVMRLKIIIDEHCADVV